MFYITLKKLDKIVCVKIELQEKHYLFDFWKKKEKVYKDVLVV